MIIDLTRKEVGVRIEPSSHIEESAIKREFETHINFDVCSAIYSALPDTLSPNTFYLYIRDGKLCVIVSDEVGYIAHIHGPRGLLKYMRTRFTICATKTAAFYIKEKTKYMQGVLHRYGYEVWDIANGNATG